MLQRVIDIGRRLLRSEAPLVGALALATLASDRLLLPALALALLYWPLRMATTGRISRRTPADAALLLLLALLPGALWATTDVAATLVQAARLWLGVLLLYALVNGLHGAGRRAQRLLTGALLLVAAGLAALVWLPALPGAALANLARAQSVNPNVIGGALALLLPLPLAWLLFSWHSLRRVEHGTLWLALTLALPALLWTRSRGALLGLLLAAGVLLVLRWRRLAWGALPLLLALALAAGSGRAQRLLDALLVSSDTSGFAERLAIWERAVLMIYDFSLTGSGMGQFGPLVDTVYPFGDIAPGTIPHAHNLLLQVAVDLGLPGLLAWLVVWLAVVLAGAGTWQRAHAAGDRWLAGAAAGLLAAQVVLLGHGLVDATLWGTRPALLVWALWGSMLVLAGSAPKQKHRR